MKGLMQELVFMTVLMAVNIVPVFILLIISVKFFCFINEKLISKWCAGNYLVPTVVIAIFLDSIIILPVAYELFFQTVLKELILEFFV